MNHTARPSHQWLTAFATVVMLLPGCNAEPIVPETAPANPQFRVISVGADSTLVAVVNPDPVAATRDFGICPVAAERMIDGRWQHAGYLMRDDGERLVMCEAVAHSLLPGGEFQFWVPVPLPFEGSPVRLGIEFATPNVSADDQGWIWTGPIEPPQ